MLNKIKMYPITAVFCVLALLFAVAMAAPVSAEEGGGKESSEKPKPDENNNVDEFRDPTQASPKLNHALHGNPRQVVQAAQSLPKIPEIVLKGLVENADKQLAAAIEVNGKNSFLIHEGSHFTVNSKDGKSLTLTVTVKQLSADGIVIEIPELKETITLR